ncbi:MAG: molybdenum cofactor guanylyltransferase MobA [Rhodobacteraceae bacterium]|nr:molybdenum cofactor guanylyltransferase MobA [Paracoccaceae bacterium]
MTSPEIIAAPLRPSSPQARIAGVVLAGGQSSRMGGGDKCLLPLGGQPILSHVIDRISPQVEAAVLNANGDPARFSAFGLPVVADSISGFAGPLAGVLAGLDWAAENGFSHIVSTAADSPFFPPRLVTGLRFACEASGLPMAMAHSPRETGGYFRQPTFALYDVSLRENLRTALQGGVRKVIQWVEPLGCAPIVFHGFSEDPFFNINTPEDLVHAEGLL